MPASSRQRLPPELVIEIAERTYDPVTLCAGSLVCRSWTSAFQRSLFDRSIVSLCTSPHPHGRGTPAAQFLNFLRQSTTLGNHVRALKIPINHDARHRHGEHEAAAFVLASTTQLRSLTLNGLSGDRMASFDASPSLLEALSDAIQRPSFTQLFIEHLLFDVTSPLRLLRGPLPSLQRLHLDGVHFDADFKRRLDESSSRSNIPDAPLSFIESFESTVDLADVLKLFGPFSIKCLHTNCSERHFDAVLAHEDISSNLVELLDVAHYLVELDRFPRLRRLSLRNQDMPLDLSQLILLPPSHEPHHIEWLSIRIWNTEGLHALDQFSSSDRFPSLKSLTLIPDTWNPSDPTYSRFIPLVHECLPGLSARGLIHFDDSQWRSWIFAPAFHG